MQESTNRLSSSGCKSYFLNNNWASKWSSPLSKCSCRSCLSSAATEAYEHSSRHHHRRSSRLFLGENANLNVNLCTARLVFKRHTEGRSSCSLINANLFVNITIWTKHVTHRSTPIANLVCRRCTPAFWVDSCHPRRSQTDPINPSTSCSTNYEWQARVLHWCGIA